MKVGEAQMRRNRGMSLVWLLALGMDASAQLAHRGDQPGAPAATASAPRRQRLILKDGGFQVVMSYTVVKDRVRYVSAERGGETEEIPLRLVDLEATKRWAQEHAAPDPNAPAAARPAPAIDPELLKEEAERAALSPEVATGPDTSLRLEPTDSVLALDTYQATPELVPLAQSQGELNKQTGHSVLRGIIKPASAPHQVVVLKGERAAVQMHVDDPVIYVKLDDALPTSGEALTVDTHGAGSRSNDLAKKSDSDYVIVRLDVRQDARVVASFNLAQLGTGRRQEDVTELDATELPGGHWLKLVPREQLLVGEYALVEVLGEKEINLGVWEFGVHPTSPENRDLVKPEKRRPGALERHEPQ